MDDTRSLIFSIVGAVIAVLLQAMCAPNIAIGSSLPNFIAAYACALAIVCPDRVGPIFAFVLGLAFDLMSTGPVGAMAFLLLVACVLVSRVYFVLDNDTVFIPLFILVVALFAIEFFYGAFLVGTGASNALDAFIYRALPCALYDFVVAVIWYMVASRVLGGAQSKSGNIILR